MNKILNNRKDLLIFNSALIRLPEVLCVSGMSRSTVYSRIQEGLWPKPINLGGRAVAWSLKEVETVNQARIQGKSNDEIRLIVQELEKNRKLNFVEE